MELIAYQIHAVPEFKIEPAANTRGWMDASEGRFAYRCLPLVMANQFGWVIRNPITFDVYWNGEGIPGKGLCFNFEDPDSYLCNYMQDHFGDGILTFSIPYLFRTSPDYGLIVRGPTNAWVPGAAPLDGFVETDWLESSFTMNWKIVEPNRVVRFDKGFPICMVQPFPRKLLESVETKVLPLEANPELKANHEKWANSRDTFNKNPERKASEWQKDYFQGKTQTGDKVDGHITRLKLGEFG